MIEKFAELLLQLVYVRQEEYRMLEECEKEGIRRVEKC